MTSFVSHNEAETAHIAAELAQQLKAGDVVALYGTLGAGKTAFCRGLIQALMPNQDVPSPTFTLLQVYDTPRFSIYHFDLYRLKTEDEVYELGIEDAFAEGVSLIEWPEKMAALLPQRHIRIQIEPDGTERRITIERINL